jgi:hypothetical protein
MAITTETKKTTEVEKPQAPNLRFQRDRDRELVKGIFKNYEQPGGYLAFSTKFYKEDPVEKWELYDEQVYSLPRCVVRHINTNMWYPIHAHAVDADGKNIVKIGKKVRRAGFHSLEFSDLEDVHAQIVTVEKTAPGL